MFRILGHGRQYNPKIPISKIGILIATTKAGQSRMPDISPGFGEMWESTAVHRAETFF
jgi:hypothetical protein